MARRDEPGLTERPQLMVSRRRSRFERGPAAAEGRADVSDRPPLTKMTQSDL